jgi:aminoglycoside phosphotransferase (APT) family kinase protein
MDGELEWRAAAAAAAVATSSGLAFDAPRIVYAGSNVIVRLDPAPVVARVMTGTVILHDDPRRWMEREVAVLRHLALQPAAPAVAPSSLVAPGPHQQDGLWMIFTDWIEDLGDASGSIDPGDLGRSLRDLHRALAGFDGELAGISGLLADIRRLHGQLRPVRALPERRIAALEDRLDQLEAEVSRSDLPSQALHGDVSVSNLLRTPARAIWNDFEDVFRGPLHWDVSSCVISLRSRGRDERAVRRLLDAYGWPDERSLAPFTALHVVYGEIWRAYDRQRRRPG